MYVWEREKKRERACCFPIHGRGPPHKSNKTMDFDFLAGLSGCGICHRPATHWLVRWPDQTDETINLWWEDLYIAMWGSTERCKHVRRKGHPAEGTRREKQEEIRIDTEARNLSICVPKCSTTRQNFPLLIPELSANTSYNTAGHTAAA